MANCRPVEHFYLKFCFPPASAILAAALKIQKNLFSKRVKRGEKWLNQESPFWKEKQIGIIWLDSHKGNISSTNMTDTKKRPKKESTIVENSSEIKCSKANKITATVIKQFFIIEQCYFLTVLYFQLCSSIDSKVNILNSR